MPALVALLPFEPVREFSIISGNNALNPFAEVDYKTSGGDDSYNALQMTLARRITTGLTLNSQYTFSRSFGNTAGSNEARTSAIPDDFEADRGYNNFDVRHTFNFSALYKLPFGKGTSHDFGTVGNALLGDWEIGGIVNARSGLPIEVGIVRPDVVMQCAPATCPVTINGVATTVPQGFVAQLDERYAAGRIRRRDQYAGWRRFAKRSPAQSRLPGVSPYLNNDRSLINPAAFSIPLPGTSATCRATLCVVQTSNSLIWCFNKRFPLTESTNLEFRTEIFNIFNFANFAVPSTTLEQCVADDYHCGCRFQPEVFSQAVGSLNRRLAAPSDCCDRQLNAPSDWERIVRSSLRYDSISRVLSSSFTQI